MAMLMAWQTVNAVRSPASRQFTRGFLIVTPGITIRDRLRVLQPNDPDSYYKTRELVPADMLEDINKAKIVITNYHGFQPRELMDTNKVGRSLLQGRSEAPKTQEAEGQMVRRVAQDLMGLKNIVVINDEAHHCYRERPGNEGLSDLKGDEKREAEEESKAAPPLDQRNRSVQAQARRPRRLRPLRDAFLPQWIGLGRRNALSLDRSVISL